MGLSHSAPVETKVDSLRVAAVTGAVTAVAGAVTGAVTGDTGAVTGAVTLAL